MSIVAVTRLRLRDHEESDDFLGLALALLEQAEHSHGIRGLDTLADAHDVWWSVSCWRDRASVDDYVHSNPHAEAMTRLEELCDEASFIDWIQAGDDLPDWATAHRRLVDQGRSAMLSSQSASNESRAFPPPRDPQIQPQSTASGGQA